VRHFVLALALLVAVPVAAQARGQATAHRGGKRHKSPAMIHLTHVATHESFDLVPDRSGQVPRKEMRALRHFLRCHHSGREHAIDPRLARLLYATAHHFGDRPVSVIAGYRAPRVAREKGNPRSHHKEGRACDFRIEGVANETVRDYLRGAYHGVGVGYYPNAGFVHLDVGRKKNGYWVDYSGPGERARYAPPDETPRPDAATPASADDPGLPLAAPPSPPALPLPMPASSPAP
jgi:uncharacterized protein YcbK (DUF882 family)